MIVAIINDVVVARFCHLTHFKTDGKFYTASRQDDGGNTTFSITFRLGVNEELIFCDDMPDVDDIPFTEQYHIRDVYFGRAGHFLYDFETRKAAMDYFDLRFNARDFDARIVPNCNMKMFELDVERKWK